MVERAAKAQTWYTCIVQSHDIGRTGEVVALEESLLTTSDPFVAVEAIGVQACNNHRLIVEGSIAFAKTAQQLDTCLVPGTGDDGCLTLWARRTKEINGFVVGVGQTYRNNQVTCAYI